MRPGRTIATIGVVAVAAALWMAMRHAAPTSGLPSAEDPGAGERVTIRFFSDPKPVATFTAADLDGRQISTGAFKGKVVIVNFWATWCPPCRAEIPDLIALQHKYEGTLQVIGVSQDEVPAEEVKRFATSHGINYPIVMASAEIERLFPGVHALPTSFVIDREGRLVQKHVGMLNAELTELETRSLAGLPVNASIEHVDQSQGLSLANGAQALKIPGVDLAALPPSKRTEALQKLNGQPCTCGCDLTVARCRVDDPNCGISLPLAREIVQKIACAQ
jgi:thiol-disulfide isomerase/thioredoxin